MELFKLGKHQIGLKNKIFYKINGTKIIDWIIIRTKKAKLLDKIIFAIPKNKFNRNLKKHLIGKKLNIYEGDVNTMCSVDLLIL